MPRQTVSERPIYGQGKIREAVVAVVMVVAAVEVAVVLVVVIVSLWMIHSLQTVQFCCFLKRRNGPTDLRTYGRTDRPSYRDARTHLKKKAIRLNTNGTK